MKATPTIDLVSVFTGTLRSDRPDGLFTTVGNVFFHLASDVLLLRIEYSMRHTGNMLGISLLE
jgi:hypothetical protein